MAPETFAREHLGWWPKVVGAETVISAADWNACRNLDPSREGIVVYAVKFSADGKSGVLAACHRQDGEKPFVYVVRSVSLSDGIGWFVDTIADNWRKAAEIVIDGQSNAQALQDRLVSVGVPYKRILRPRAGDVTAANSMLLNAVRERGITHYGQEALDISATQTTRRRIGNNGGWGFQSTEKADATLIEAASLAHWGAMTTKRKPGRKAVVRI